MALLMGQAIDGRELEQATSPWSPERFAAMCDALVWAASGRQCPGLPDFNCRVNAKDGGIDAEWCVDLPHESRDVPTPFVGPGWNVFQYKKRDLIAQDRRRVISNLKSSLTGAVSDLVKQDKNGQYPDRYILFGNVDLKSGDKSALRESILKGYRDDTRLHVEIIGASVLVCSQSCLMWGSQENLRLNSDISAICSVKDGHRIRFFCPLQISRELD